MGMEMNVLHSQREHLMISPRLDSTVTASHDAALQVAPLSRLIASQHEPRDESKHVIGVQSTLPCVAPREAHD
jgi:hypothetical protein